MRVLATDLDGTFLGGTDRARRALTAHFRDAPDRKLLYVTGRSARSVTALVGRGLLPRPDAMICDVGAFVAHADGAPYEGALLESIRQAWGDRSERVRTVFADLPRLRIQDHFGPYRVSYYFDSTDVLPEAHARAAALGCDGLVSDDQYFDVLPRGVNKGTTLVRLMHEWGVADDEVLVAGDTLNDLAMLVSGLPAVVVGNAEPALLAALPSSERIRRASAHGADGIVEALTAMEVGINV